MFDKPAPRKAAGERARVRAEYKGYLTQLAAGEGGELTLGEGDLKITVRNRLNRAADELGVKLEYKRSRSAVIRFRIVTE
jgi:hypothetical protein